MVLQFSKWHGTGNDFILIDDRAMVFPDSDAGLVQRLCHRHFGIGSDGLILIRPPRSANVLFHMEFLNPDGSRSFCGNGSRCAYAFWCVISGDRSPARFTAIDGEHAAEWRTEKVAVSLADVERVQEHDEHTDRIDTGSPHELVWVQDPELVPVVAEGRRRRYGPEHGPGGTNVNFIQVRSGTLHMRTYERGVEDETLSCGTGVVAAALSGLSRGRVKAPVPVHTRGGDLTVEAEPNGGAGWRGIRLIGPAEEIFQGTIHI